MPFALVVVQPGEPAHAVDEEVRIAIVVIVDPGAALVELLAFAVDAGLGGDLFECAVAAIVIQPVGLLFAGDEEVEPAVVVVIGPGGRVGVDGLEQAGFLRDVA